MRAGSMTWNIFTAVGFLLATSVQTLSQDNSEPIELPLGPDGKVTYEAVVTVTGYTAPQLQEKALQWVQQYFKNPQQVLKKKEPGKLVIEHKIRIYDTDPKTGRKYFKGNVKFTLYLFFRDGKFKYRITNIRYIAERYIPIESWLDKKDPTTQSYLRQIDEALTELIANLRTFMRTEPKQYNPEEW